MSTATALATLPNGLIALGSSDGTIWLWHPSILVEGGRRNEENPIVLEGQVGPVTALVALPDGRLASGSSDGTIWLWHASSLVNGRRRTEGHISRPIQLEGHEDSVSALTVLPDGRLASSSFDHTIRVWDAKSLKEKAKLEGGERPVNALVALPEARLASGAGDRTIRLWDADTAKELARLEVDFAVLCLAVLGDKRLAAGDGGGRIHWLEIVD
jgi:WD40 repeat protein